VSDHGHRCAPGVPHLPIGGSWAIDGPRPPREAAPGGQQQREPGKPPARESVTLTRPKDKQ
jgi:hypothetical protein